MQPNVLTNKLSHYAHPDEMIRDLHEKHLTKQQQFFADKKEKEKEKKNKKVKKDKSTKKSVHEDRILIKPPASVTSSKKEQPAQRYNVPPHHEYQNITEEQRRLLMIEDGKNQENNLRRFGDTTKLNAEKKAKCAIQNGLYAVYNSSSTGSSLTSFAEIDLKSSKSSEFSNGKLKNFSLSKYLNIDIKSPSPVDKSGSDKTGGSSSKSSSLSNKSVDSMEQAIIMNGLQNSTDNQQINSYLGPFNFRKLLKPTGIAPTESLRKRKTIINASSPPPPNRGRY